MIAVLIGLLLVFVLIAVDTPFPERPAKVEIEPRLARGLRDVIKK